MKTFNGSWWLDWEGFVVYKYILASAKVSLKFYEIPYTVHKSHEANWTFQQ